MFFFSMVGDDRAEATLRRAAPAIDDTDLQESEWAHVRLRALMLHRAARRERTAAISALLGVALVAYVQGLGTGQAIVPYFVALRLLFLAYNHWLARRILALRDQPLRALACESRFVMGMGGAGACWGLVGWMVPDLDLASWTARDVFSIVMLVYVSCVVLIGAAHCPRAIVAHIGAQWLMALVPPLTQREALEDNLIIVVAVLVLLATLFTYGHMLVRQTRDGVRAELQRADLTESLRAANRSLEQALQSAVEAANRDLLTGVYNRRALYERAEQIAAARRRHERPCATLLMDLDNFKRINDRYGHAAGDAVLVAVASALKRSMREVDVVARWGGEEFLVLLPDCGVGAALQRAEQVRNEVARLEIAALPMQHSITISIGVAVWQADVPLDEMITQADRALYAAKGQGRNCVVLAS